VKMILPFIEEQALADRWQEGTIYCVQPNLDLCRIPIAVHICPSDSPTHSQWDGNSANIVNFNYAVNLGRTTLYRASPWHGVTFKGAPFHYEEDPGMPIRAFNLKSITDGTSKTLMFAEVRQGGRLTNGLTTDLRGLTWYGHHAGITTHELPNTMVPDYLQAGFCPDPTGAMTSGMPCADEVWPSTPKSLSSRSTHPGGVQVSLCDGSVRFVTDEIDLTAWRNFGSSMDNEVLRDF